MTPQQARIAFTFSNGRTQHIKWSLCSIQKNYVCHGKYAHKCSFIFSDHHITLEESRGFVLISIINLEDIGDITNHQFDWVFKYKSNIHDYQFIGRSRRSKRVVFNVVDGKMSDAKEIEKPEVKYIGQQVYGKAKRRRSF